MTSLVMVPCWRFRKMKYMMDAQDKSDEMGITFNRDAATTYYLDQQFDL